MREKDLSYCVDLIVGLEKLLLLLNLLNFGIRRFSRDLSIGCIFGMLNSPALSCAQQLVIIPLRQIIDSWFIVLSLDTVGCMI